MNNIRWLLTIPSAIGGWIVGILVTIVIYWLNDGLCPANYLLSDHCVYAPWTPAVQKSGLALGSLTSAFLGVLLPTLVAPTYRFRIAIAAYLMGLACAVFYAVAAPSFFAMPATLAACSGWLTLLRIRSVLTNHRVTH
ncbi:hypothetical protein [Novimethylophilus kurashikiensis]|uniref:hypothetical protein n=1 Tax=Novimethylophilus kurashikiensis TaxID=1825523 RepID=UPI0011B20166|nr:hypothetical protein [Novimethylophilus kurashikiensis]